MWSVSCQEIELVVDLRSGQVMSGHVRSCHVMSGQVMMSGHVMSGQVRSGQVRSDQVRSCHGEGNQAREIHVGEEAYGVWGWLDL